VVVRDRCQADGLTGKDHYLLNPLRSLPEDALHLVLPVMSGG